jgi:hypothetical protein
MNMIHALLAAPVDRRHESLYRAFAGEVPVREVREAALIARKTDSEPPRTICPWCPDFKPDDPALAGVSHGICERCSDKLNADIDRREAEKSRRA